MEVIFKEGMLYLQGVKFGKRSWRKMWVVLFKPSSTGVGRLEFFTVADSSSITDQKKTGRQKVVRLSDCLSATPALKESCPAGCTAFYLNTTQCTYTFASTAAQEWLSALCLLAFQKDPGEGDFDGGNGLTMEDNDIYSSWKSDQTLPPNHYQVTVQSTEAAKRCKLSGEYLVFPDTEAVILQDISTGYIIYRWPYRLLRKFGQVEGGFSIEAGRRCDSGEGVFTFLTRHGPQIFQAISTKCAVERQSCVQPLHRRSLSDLSSFNLLPTKQHAGPTGPTVYYPADVPAAAKDEDENHYSTINDISVQNVKLSLVVRPQLRGSREAVGEEEEDEEDEDQRCHSLDSLDLDNIFKDKIYYNIGKSTPPLMRKDPIRADTDDPECIYSHVKRSDSPSNLHPQPFSSPLQPSIPPPPPCMPPKHVPYAPPKPRIHPPPPVSNYIQPGYNTPAQAADDMKETEEAISSSARAAPTEAPGSFKHRLAEIISKDLAKFQPPLPHGAGSPTFSQ